MAKIIDVLERNPVIPAIKNEDFLEEAIDSSNELNFIVMSSLLNIKKIVNKLKENGKVVFVHIDMVSGLSSENYTVDYIMNEIAPHGLITTKHNIVSYAKKQKISIIQRFFIIDSFSLENSIIHIRENKPDAIEVLPGIIPSIITRIEKLVKIPIIASGLIETKDDITKAINAGAIGVSTSKKKLWNI